MGASLIFWSRKPIPHKKVLTDLVEAAYESRLPFYLYGYEEYKNNDINSYKPYSFTVNRGNPEYTPMIFHISSFEDQTGGIEKWENERFINYNKNMMIFPELYRLAVTEDIDLVASYDLVYYYLRINKKQLISIDSSVIFDWSKIKEIHNNGYTQFWWQT